MQSLLVSDLLLSGCPTTVALRLIAANDTRRCASCFTWFVNMPSITDRRTKRPIEDRDWDTCPTCQAETFALARMRETRALTTHHRPSKAAEEEAKANLPREARRYRAHRDVQLYRALLAFGALPLPPRAPSDRGPLTLDVLTWTQERALFHALRDLGAFRYPGMAEGCFCDERGRAVSDEKIYEMIRLCDIRWNMYRGWVKDGRRVNFRKPVVEREGVKSGAGVLGRGARRWRGRGMYAKMAPRMERGMFTLEVIAEGDEVEAAVDELWSYEPLNRAGSRLIAKDTKPVKNFSRPFGVQKEERPQRAVVGSAETTWQVQHVSASRQEVVGSHGGRRRMTKAAPN